MLEKIPLIIYHFSVKPLSQITGENQFFHFISGTRFFGFDVHVIAIRKLEVNYKTEKGS